MTDLGYGIVGCLALLLLLAGSMPVAFAMATIGMVGIAVLRESASTAMSAGVSQLRDTLANYQLTVIPLFVLMGQLAFHSGISRRLFDAAYKWIGRLPGGLAMATVGACTAFGAICGSSPATAATMSAVALPEMKRYKYSMQLGSGAVAAGGSLGMLIPPSVVFIVYAVLTQQSIGKLFLAGVLPGLLVAGLFCLTILLLCLRRPELGPAGPKVPFGAKLRALLGVGETIILFALVIGGMFLGWFTPTQAAAVGAGGSLVLALVSRRLSIKTLARSLKETARTSCMIFAIIAGANIFGVFLKASGLTDELAVGLASLPLPAWGTMGLIILFYLIGGCFVDALALMLLTVPVFEPVVTTQLGYDSIWFGVMIVLVTQMGVISPPVGVNVYVVSGIERDLPLQTIFRGAMPFLLALIVAAVLLIAVPDICLVLPRWIQ